MSIQVYNSLTRAKAPLEPLEPGVVRMYVCGPTVYDDCHIGHLMGPVVFDTIGRWIVARGYRLQVVNNITDIDDKIIRRALETGEDWRSISERYTEQYLQFLRELGVTTISDHPRCTEYVEQMVAFIEQLVAEDRAYPTADGVYFDVERQLGYGKLSGRKVEDMQAGARVAAGADLRHPADFALWKKAKPGEPTWPSPWGDGRPGWHIECSVMASALLGPTFDIHGGGDDLKFPHHENEIAQSEAHGDAYAACWMHHGLIQYGGRKIAKSDPRMQDPEFALQFNARWLLDTYGAPAVRYFLVRSPYRSPIDFEPGTLRGARTGLVRLHKLLGALLEEPDEPTLDEILARELPAELAAQRATFVAAMDDDFNTGEAVAALFKLAVGAKGLAGDARDTALRLLRDLGRVLGLLMPGDAARLAAADCGDERLGAVLDAALAVRQGARERKDFATADGLRELFAAQSVKLLDGPSGSTWELDGASDERLGALLDGLLALRGAARGRADFATSDAIRDALADAGVNLLDGPQGTRWELV
jgi:cysteinyl-tRNA synthetase